MEASQAQWLWPRWQEKTKEERPQEALRPSRSRTTSGQPGIDTPRVQPSSTAGCKSRSSRAGHQVPTRRCKAKRPHSSTPPTARRRLLLPRAGATSRLKPLLRTTRTMTRAQALGVPGWGKTQTTQPIRLATGARQGPSRAAAAPGWDRLAQGGAGPRQPSRLGWRQAPQGKTCQGAPQEWAQHPRQDRQ
jgi:hypothetical protein